MDVTPIPAPVARRKPGPKPKNKVVEPPAEAPDEQIALAVRTGSTIYTNPLTGEHITYGQMRALLADRRLVPRERFVSSRGDLMEVRDFGKKLKLVRVQT